MYWVSSFLWGSKALEIVAGQKLETGTGAVSLLPVFFSSFFKISPTWSPFGRQSLKDSIITVGKRDIGSGEQEDRARESRRRKAAPAAFDWCESESVLRSGAASQETDVWRDGRRERGTEGEKRGGRRMGNESYVGAEGQMQPRSMGDD